MEKLPLIEVEEKAALKTVRERSYLELKTRNPGVFGVKKEFGWWVGVVEVDAPKKNLASR